ncbi:MAG TPA: PAS domain S-box protein [Candidatus Omnitrophota bacterium]|nr:PAS domain S-box protein [Candidatus Omnitrophota bacterium]
MLKPMLKKSKRKSPCPEAFQDFSGPFSNFVDCLPDSCFVIDREKIVVAWNREMERLTGVPRAAILGKGRYEYALPFYGQRRPILIDLLLEGQEEVAQRYRITKKTIDALEAETTTARLKGKNVFIWGRASLLRDPGGQVVGAIEIIRDVTDIKKVEAALKESEQRLGKQKAALEQKNVDLQDILEQVETEKRKIQENVMGNVQHVLLPMVKKIKLKNKSEKNLILLQQALEQMTSAFGRKLSCPGYGLTTREIEICHMIKSGLSGKEMAGLLGLSFNTIEMHRKNIRRKLGLSHQKINLTSFLQRL